MYISDFWVIEGPDSTMIMVADLNAIVIHPGISRRSCTYTADRHVVLRFVA